MEQQRRVFNFSTPRNAATPTLQVQQQFSDSQGSQSMSPSAALTARTRLSQQTSRRDGSSAMMETTSESNSGAQHSQFMTTTSLADDAEDQEALLWSRSRFTNDRSVGASRLAQTGTSGLSSKLTSGQETTELSSSIHGGGTETDVVQSREDSEIILAVNYRGRQLGCAYFDTRWPKLFIMNDMTECKSLDVLEMQNIEEHYYHLVKVQVRPTLIFVSSRLEETMLEILKSDVGGECKVEVRPNGEFSPPLGKSKLISVMINTSRAARPCRANEMQPPPAVLTDDATRKEGEMLLANIIDIQSTESIGCAGAIISHLSRNGLAHRNIRDGRSLTMFTLTSFSIDKFMFINANALSSLQIFEDETHPSMHVSIRGRKEGLSLFGEYINLDIIRSRHQTVKCFLQPEHSDTVDQLANCLGHIKNMPKILLSLHRRINISEWQAIHQFAYHTIKIRNLAQEFALDDSPILRQLYKIQEQFSTNDLMDIGAMINNVLDFDESVIEGRCVVKHNVDEQLDEMRRTYQGLDSFLSEIAKKISGTIPTDFTHAINVIYFPQLGYLIAVPMNAKWKTPEDFELEGLCFQFKTENTVYYKNDEMRQLDEHLGDLHGLIVDREIDILQALQERIQGYEMFLLSCSEVCSELDALLALAYTAKLRNYIQPTMTEQNTLWIDNGRHPLQELSVDSFVPNDTRLGDTFHPLGDSLSSTISSHQGAVNGTSHSAVASSDSSGNDENKVMILCGANCSGKSVYLKQVALITYMAHVGSFVPAEAAIIGITDKILTRLQTCDTVSHNRSVFMTDLQQVSLAIRMSTRRSLVILDEFGKGTASTDGAGLFCGTIEHFAKRRDDRPKVVATTHFHELCENSLLDMTLPISFYMMKIFQGPEDQDATFLFRVVPGKSPSSLGPACAASSGVPMHVVKRGAYLSTLFRRYETVMPIMDEHELELMTMYETLVGILVSLDLEQGNHVGDQPQRPLAENVPIQAKTHVAITTDNAAQDMTLDDAGPWTDKRIRAYFESEEASQDLDELDYDGIGQVETPVPMPIQPRSPSPPLLPAALTDTFPKDEERQVISIDREQELQREIDVLMELAAQVAKFEQEYTSVLNASSSESFDSDEDD
ncbi:MutS protein msh5 [Podila epigama]|nr:MutS protein msh5 [Podila epigama]